MYTGSLGEITNAETWAVTVAVINEADGTDVAIGTATITAAVRSKLASVGDSADLTASTDDGSVTIASPEFTFTFSVAQMGGLDTGLYDVGVVILLNGVTSQLILGTISVVDGIVT